MVQQSLTQPGPTVEHNDAVLYNASVGHLSYTPSGLLIPQNPEVAQIVRQPPPEQPRCPILAEQGWGTDPSACSLAVLPVAYRDLSTCVLRIQPTFASTQWRRQVIDLPYLLPYPTVSFAFD